MNVCMSKVKEGIGKKMRRANVEWLDDIIIYINNDTEELVHIDDTKKKY